MGYSIAIRCRNLELKKKMKAFMEANFRDPSVVFERECSGVEFSDDLSYDHSKFGLGFDYGVLVDPARAYIDCVLKWLAIKVGKRLYFKRLGRSVHHYVYDGYETTPILLESEWPVFPQDFGWAMVNDIGFRSYTRSWGNAGNPLDLRMAFKRLAGMDVKKMDRIILSELKRLDKEWSMVSGIA